MPVRSQEVGGGGWDRINKGGQRAFFMKQQRMGMGSCEASTAELGARATAGLPIWRRRRDPGRPFTHVPVRSVRLRSRPLAIGPSGVLGLLSVYMAQS